MRRPLLLCGMGLCLLVNMMGCRQAWYAPWRKDVPEMEQPLPQGIRPVTYEETSGPPAAPSSVATPPVSPLPASESEAMRAILADLQSIEDSAAREQLVQELQAVDPQLWPLFVQHYRAALAYREQLNEAPQLQRLPGRQPAPRSNVEASTRRTTATSPTSAEANRASQGDNTDGLQVASSASAAANQVDSPDLPELAASVEPLEVAPFERQSSGQVPPARRGVDAERISAVRLASYEQVTEAEAAPLPRMELSPGQFTAEEPAVEAEYQEAMPESLSPLNPTTPLSWQDALEEAIRLLEGEAESNGAAPPEVAARVRLLRMLVGQTEGAMQPIAGLPPAEQEFWKQNLFALKSLLEPNAEGPAGRRAAGALPHLRGAAQALAEAAPLALRRLTFCRDVRAFGAIEEIKNPRFSPADRVTLYAEIENYKSERTPDGFRSQFVTTFEIVDETGRQVGSGQLPDVEDLSLSLRRDFFIKYSIGLPSQMGPGQYRLILTIEDVLAKKLGTGEVEFAVD